MKIATAGELARVLAEAEVACELVGDPGTIIGPDVVIDSRRATPGALFVALPGERVDGNDYVTAARQAGASAALTGRPVTDGPTLLVVPDAQQGLTELARAWHRQAAADGLNTVGITGSSGKTSTKDLLAQILGAHGATVSPVGSFNNELGTPLTIAQIDERTRYLICEMGSRAAGDIGYLCSIAQPTVGVVLNVGTAHLGEFGSQQGIAQAKGEMVEALSPQGWAVLNADDPLVDRMAGRTRARVAKFSLAGNTVISADLVVRVTDLVADDLDRYRCKVAVHQSSGLVETADVQLQVMGRHQVSNAAAAITAAVALEVPLPVIARALDNATTCSPWRMELHELAHGPAVINDAYNANPDSMSAAIRTLATIGKRRRARDPGARAIAVLGDMLELGPDSAELHRRMGELAAELGVDLVLAIGDHAPDIVAGASSVGVKAREVAADEVTAAIELRGADIVLVKASRGMALEKVAAALIGGEQQP